MGGRVFTTLAVCLVAFGVRAEDVYQWPLDLPRVLTSSFAEYRVGRYHMGIDLRTGPVGKNVYAAEDGYVSRIRCSPYGYGKAIYLTLNDGNTVVYAHLNDFAPRFRAYVWRAQHDREKYTVDLYPDPGLFPIERGELIAESGQTGIGVPHLHYEIRDRTGAPINPRSLGITWPDTTPPRIRKAVVIPLAPETTINGDVLPVVLSAPSVGGSHYRTEPVAISGPVAFGLDVIDPANGGSTRLGVYRVVTTVDGEEVFRMQHDRVDYADDQDGAVAYDPFLLDQGRFLLQWRWPGNDSAIFYHGPSDGRFELTGNAAEARLSLSDFYENEAELEIPLVHDATVVDAPTMAHADATGEVSYEFFGHGLVITAVFSDDEPVAPEVSVATEPAHEIPMRRIDGRTFRAVYRPSAAMLDTEVAVKHPRVDAAPARFVFITRDAPSTLHRFGHLLVRTRPDSPYGLLALRATPATVTADRELTPAGPAYELWPDAAPLEAPITLSFPEPEGPNPEFVHIYRKGEREWEFLDTRRVRGRLEADTTQLGTFAVMRDTTPPAIDIQRPRPAEVFVSARPTLRARVRDLGSGIGEFGGTYNGAWILMAYDPEHDVLTWEQDEDLPVGPGEVVFEVRDEAGNVARQSVNVTLPESAR